MKRLIFSTTILLIMSIKTFSFCGFYVAKADAKLFNKSSEVILVRDGLKTTVTMSNDFQGNIKDFAMVVPVPTVLKRNDIKTVKPTLFKMLDSYSAPRLAEYYDQNPCAPPPVDYRVLESLSVEKVPSMSIMADKSLGKNKVTIEARYEVDEYDILILSAKESNGLKNWLIENGYKIPEKAEKVLRPYIKNKMKFFVVKVNLDRVKNVRYNKDGNQVLSPLQITYNSGKFMLPIRLGMANSKGTQDLIVYAFSRTGRIECTNYRTVDVPNNRDIPSFVKRDFGNFYKDLFDKNYTYQGKNAVFLEYAWNVTPSFSGMKCDPCVGPPPITQQLLEAGVSWANKFDGQQVYFTRLHTRYDRENFPQDLQFQTTPNKQNFQARYVIRNVAQGKFDCDEGQKYLKEVVNRRTKEVNELIVLTDRDKKKYQFYIDEYKHMIKDYEEEDSDDRGSIISPYIDNNSANNSKIWISLTLIGMLMITFLISRVKTQNKI